MTCNRGDNSTTEKAAAEIADTAEEIGPCQRENATPIHTENIAITSHKLIIQTPPQRKIMYLRLEQGSQERKRKLPESSFPRLP